MRTTLLLLCAALATAACTSQPPTDEPVRSVREQTVTCPAEVEIAVILPHACGELVVPEDRAHPDGPSVRLVYVRVRPDDDAEGEIPTLAVGYELAQPPDFGDIVGITQSTGRELVLLSQRGSGLSEPRLDCPGTEVEGLLDPPAPIAADRFAAAVRKCRNQLVRDGIDPKAYSVDAAARDIADLRSALGIPAWDLVAWGSASRILVAYAALEPKAVHAMSLQSPQLPGADPLGAAATDVTRAATALAVECAGERRCQWPGADVATQLARAANKLERDPVRVKTGDHELLVGGAALVRAARDRLAAEPLQAPVEIPRLVRAALQGRAAPIARLLTSRPGACLGYLPICDAPVSIGAYLSMVCPGVTEIPKVSTYPGFGKEHPFLAGCRAWDVRIPQTPSASVVPLSTPTLVMWGDLDPYVPAGISELSRELLDPYIVLVPGAGHETAAVLDCLRTVRNAWLLHSDKPPRYLDCLRSLPPSPRIH